MMLTVMTFNVRGAKDASIDGVNHWAGRRDLNLRVIQAATPDIFGLQEAQAPNRQFYAEKLPEYDSITGIEARRDFRDESVPIYWRKVRFSLVKTGSFYLSETPEVESVGWDAALQRVAVWVTLRDSDTERDITIMNAHFDHRGDRAKIESARLLVAQLAQIAPDAPQIILGDFNSLPQSEAYQAFINAGYRDTYDASSYATDVNTFHRFKGDDFDADGVRLDWIMVSSHWRMDSCAVITIADPPLYPSDHYPVVARVTLAS